MNNSPPPHAYEYDPHLEFAQFLKEAKTHACHPKSLHATGKDQLSGPTKSNKSWKSSLFSWLKPDKKSTKSIIEEEQPPPSKSNPETRRGYVSGPINRIITERPKRPTSGHLVSTLFKTRVRGEEFQMSYVSLAKSSNPQDVKPYGPVYMVT
ncbi:hypothetical protein L6452_07889 [Arctium lappa]|uniref:Uncharacterized protein n=1 Tax=Arctium lappa TaxID=4217 RepID=A0ACB9ELT2_ARCLA|nr:hypothetical protein L6452_07889 [Arctium lappa]